MTRKIGTFLEIWIYCARYTSVCSTEKFKIKKSEKDPTYFVMCSSIKKCLQNA